MLLLFTGACGQQASEDKDPPLDEAVYLQLLVEMQLLDALVFSSDSVLARDSLEAVIFEEYEIDKPDFEFADSLYRTDIQKHRARLDTALQMIKREQLRLSAIQDSLASAERN